MSLFPAIIHSTNCRKPWHDMEKGDAIRNVIMF